ncbi:MAG: metallophosphoesterase [Candidatus Nanosalina sp.]
MRVAVVSDIHSNIEAFEAVMEDMPEVDKVLCAGDLVGYGVDPDAVVDKVRERGIEPVKGNHDEKIVTYENLDRFNRLARQALTYNRERISQENLEYLSQLPEKKSMSLGGSEVFMVHGSPRKPVEEYVREGDVTPEFLDSCFDSEPDVLIMGHTHVPFVKKVSGTLVFNPGSVGQPRDSDPRASYALLDTETLEAEIHRVEYDVEKAAEKIREDLNPLLGDRLEKGR